MKFAGEILQLLTSEDSLQEVRKTAEAAAKVKEKADKAKESVERSVQGE